LAILWSPKKYIESCEVALIIETKRSGKTYPFNKSQSGSCRISLTDNKRISYFDFSRSDRLLNNGILSVSRSYFYLLLTRRISLHEFLRLLNSSAINNFTPTKSEPDKFGLLNYTSDQLSAERLFAILLKLSALHVVSNATDLYVSGEPDRGPDILRMAIFHGLRLNSKLLVRFFRRLGKCRTDIMGLFHGSPRKVINFVLAYRLRYPN
jgi:hypothetical protein